MARGGDGVDVAIAVNSSYIAASSGTFSTSAHTAAKTGDHLSQSVLTLVKRKAWYTHGNRMFSMLRDVLASFHHWTPSPQVPEEWARISDEAGGDLAAQTSICDRSSDWSSRSSTTADHEGSQAAQHVP